MKYLIFLLFFALNIFKLNSEKNDNVKWINSNEFLQLISQFKNSNSKNYIVIDTRSSNEYNGWKSFDKMFQTEFDFNQTGLSNLYDFKSGHVTNSFNLDSDWLHLFDSTQLNTLIENRIGLKASNDSKKISVILYDINKQRLEKAKNYLNDNFNLDLIYLCKLSDDELSRYVLTSNITGNLFFQEPFYDQLLSPEALFAILRPHNVSYVVVTSPVTDYFLFEIGSENVYEQSHIPTAVFMKIEDFIDKNKRKSREEIAKNLLNYGILPYNTEMVILYGNPDPLLAFRMAIIMKAMGVKEVRVLNGGFRSWLIKNYPLETYRTKPITVNKNRIPQNLKLYEEQANLALTPINYIVDENYISDLVKNNDVFKSQYLLVDIRTHDEFVGESSGYANVKYMGRIPGSLWGKAGSDPSQLEEYRNLDYTMRPGWDILKMWDDLGIDYKKKNLIFYCGNGLRSSEVLFYAEVMGLYKISMYDGGWSDWSANLKNTFQLGEDPDEDIIAFEKYSTTSATSTSTKSGNNTGGSLSTIKKVNGSTLATTLSNTKKTTANQNDLFYKNQFDSVTADPSHGSLAKANLFCFIFSLILVINLF
ncbi:unnamed protein product [Brachionus calyciflorus]|uniref:Rhodanese domain-containing protein n=1 Tax=Brachionus calyciflorus TaxID=104777 RepID=A0A813N7R2_9BILA|nr:unnamed protein product [Brachionus calyciflorus]